MNTTTNTRCCCFCGRDLSSATWVTYVAEGAICSMCLAKIAAPKKDQYKRADDFLEFLDTVRMD